MTDTENIRHWYDIAPEDAVDIELPQPDIRGPLTTDGQPCPWPWEPQQLKGVPMGMYHCPYCDEMCVAGMPHPDYADADDPAAATVVIGVDLDAE